MKFILYLPTVIVLVLWVITAQYSFVGNAPHALPLRIAVSSYTGSCSLQVNRQNDFPFLPLYSSGLTKYKGPFVIDNRGTIPQFQPGSPVQILKGETKLWNDGLKYMFVSVSYWLIFILSLIPVGIYQYRKRSN